MKDYQSVLISKSQAEDLADQYFGKKGTAEALPGDSDYNFRITTHSLEEVILKVSRPGKQREALEFQQALLLSLENSNAFKLLPQVVRDRENNVLTSFTDNQGNERLIRMLTWVPGTLWSSINPHTSGMLNSLGEWGGKMTHALQSFTHPGAHRELSWDIAQSDWVLSKLDLFPEDERMLVSYFIEGFLAQKGQYDSLRKSVVHNDINDNNILVSDSLDDREVISLIDFGDACYTQIINDLAIAGAYVIMNSESPLERLSPLIQGYHESFPLQEEEIQCLYFALAMRLVLTVTHAAINKKQEPDNEYLVISEKPAWGALKKWRTVHPEYALHSFRSNMGKEPNENFEKFHAWVKDHKVEIKELFPACDKHMVELVDLSVSSAWLGHMQEFADHEWMEFKLERYRRENADAVIAGGYLEPRTVYNTASYVRRGDSGLEHRSVHLGVDFWLPATEPVHAIWDGEIVVADYIDQDKDYGGLIILKHTVDDWAFYTLYGHLSKDSIEGKEEGMQIRKSDPIGTLGHYEENGKWVPHLHFQVMLSMLGFENDFPGVAFPSEAKIWKSICPDPGSLFIEKIPPYAHPSTSEDLLDFRKNHLGKSLSLQYKQPIHVVRGDGAWLIDDLGRKYLDTVNNVAHTGHEHPHVVRAGQEQMALLNTNTRYLHANINTLTQEILETLPSELSVLHFVNSGSEANELAVRMVKAYTGGKDMIVSEVGYHGNTNVCVDISSYKFDGKGGQGAPPHTWVFPLPDAFRGKYRGEDVAGHYVKEVEKCIQQVQESGRPLGGLIIESIISCGGQIELPNGFLKEAYKAIRAAGGLCIADEVQTGVGRVGKAFWGFQLHDVVPDIVTIGKPLGNGHPLAAVACTREVADRFANGMEYFNTFGGNPVSCAIGTEVMRTVKRENLQQQAWDTGEFLKRALKKLSSPFPILGDVRGQGLFLGIELVDRTMTPLPQQTSYLVNRMKDFGILMSIDGPDHNVLKIKPPMVFGRPEAEELIYYMEKVLQEDFMQI